MFLSHSSNFRRSLSFSLEGSKSLPKINISLIFFPLSVVTILKNRLPVRSEKSLLVTFFLASSHFRSFLFCFYLFLFFCVFFGKNNKDGGM